MSAPSIKRRVAFIVTLLAGSVGLSACGYKAPLYIPTPEQQQKLQEREQRIQARKDKAAAEKKAKAEQERSNPQAATGSSGSTGIPAAADSTDSNIAP